MATHPCTSGMQALVEYLQDQYNEQCSPMWQLTHLQMAIDSDAMQ